MSYNRNSDEALGKELRVYGTSDPAEMADARDAIARQHFIENRPAWMDGLSERVAQSLFYNLDECSWAHLEQMFDDRYPFDRIPNVGRKCAEELTQWIETKQAAD